MIDLESLFKSTELFEAYSRYNAIWKRNPQFPYFNYFGINFDSDGILSVKFYFHVFADVAYEDADGFLPSLFDFNEYYPFADESYQLNSSQTGCAFELKFYNNGSTIKGFHLRLRSNDETFDKIGPPMKIPFKIKQFDLRPGIAFEYDAKTVLKKTYYYFDTQEYKDYFAKAFNLPVLSSASLIEYSESENFSKINTWYNDSVFHSTANLFLENQKNQIDLLCKKYALNVKIFGYYKDLSVKSVYFFNAQPELTRHEKAKNLIYTDTIGNILKKCL